MVHFCYINQWLHFWLFIRFIRSNCEYRVCVYPDNYHDLLANEHPTEFE